PLPRRLPLPLPLLAPRCRGLCHVFRDAARAVRPLAFHPPPQRAASALRVAVPLQRGFDRSLHPAGVHGCHPRREDLLMATDNTYDSYEYDVLVIGAGGAGLRAAIEARAAGL